MPSPSCPPDTPSKTIAEVVAERVREHRKRHNWSQERLVEEMEKLGYPLNRVSLSKLEAGKTRTENVPLREILVLAAALDVPPVLLFIPLGEEEDIYLTPSIRLDNHLAFRWVTGSEPFCRRGPDGGNRARNPGAWKEAARPVWLFQELGTLLDAASVAGMAAGIVDSGTPHPEHAAPVHPGAGPEFDRALQALVQHRRYMRLEGLKLSPLAESWTTRAAELGLSDGVSR